MYFTALTVAAVAAAATGVSQIVSLCLSMNVNLLSLLLVAFSVQTGLTRLLH